MQTLLRFVCVGAANTAVGYTVIILGLWLGAGDYAANAAGYMVGLTLSYQLNRRWTFAATSTASRGEAARFGVAVLTAYAVNVGVLFFVRSLGYVDNLAGQAVAQVAYSVTFFLLTRFLVFVPVRAPHADRRLAARGPLTSSPIDCRPARGRPFGLGMKTGMPAIRSAARPPRSVKSHWDIDWLQSPWLWAVLCLAAALPLIACRGLPPLTDLGGHLGRYAIQLDAGQSADLRQWYAFRWDLLPNLGVDLLTQWLAPMVGLEPALKMIVIAIPTIQVAGFLALAKVVHGRITPFALFALPLAYSYPFQFGFVNFTLSAALAAWALALWIALGERQRTGLRWLVFIPICELLWVCHLVGWALFCIFAAANEVARARDEGLSWRRAGQRVILPLACVLTPLVVKLLWPGNGGGHGEMDELFDIPQKLGFIIMPLRDSWIVWDISSALILLGLIAWGWRSGRFVRHGGLALGVTLLAAIYAVMPGTVLGSSMADMRLVPTLFAMALIAIRPPAAWDRRLALLLTLGGLAFAGARFMGNAASLVLLDRQFQQDLAILDKVPRGTSLISLLVEPCDGTYLPWRRERRSHLGGYAIARRHDFSNDQWMIPGGQLLSVHNPAAGAFATDMSELAHRPECEGDERALGTWVRGVPRTSQHLWIIDDGIAHPIPGWRPVLRSSGSVLYAPV